MFPNLRQARKEQKKTGDYMAKLIGKKGRSAYSKKERGSVPFTLEEIQVISADLNKSIDYLFSTGTA